ncbi:ParB/RepB/Spo0J family partition protein [Sneathiella sp. P13V-1]|uniref:ParB/RepB/Spo0J family partition protein n=1 Tax=Sneathiella sp. P13V-1 TaxID=2697366 RepID=UPI00187BB5B1|nr:ParB/RepB/Spo0J family partition protein [Sneathiella sp. P13V-1]MBE7636087.1 ParB/RepB/Spo0J family partition protein [Sneathiella sp. P13V-1]
MSEDTGKKKLGRGLSALLGDDSAADYSELDKVRTSKDVPVEYLHPSPFQPRQDWDQEALQSLADSIAEKGILQPILVRRDPNNSDLFEIIAGERRWRAAQIAKLHEVPVIIKDLSDVDSLEIAIIENIQREDLSAIEEAEGYKRLSDEFNYTQETLAKQLGKSRSHITNIMRLLNLPTSVQLMIRDGDLSSGAARALITADNPEKLARKVVKEGLSVRQVEKLVQKKPSNRASSVSQSTKDQDTLALEADLSAAIGLKVAINHKEDHGGQITISYEHLDQLDDICRRLTRQAGQTHEDEDHFEGDMTSALDEDFH